MDSGETSSSLYCSRWAYPVMTLKRSVTSAQMFGLAVISPMSVYILAVEGL